MTVYSVVSMRVIWLFFSMAFKKKTQRTPQKQLDKAEELMKKYFEQKKMSGNEE